MGGEGWTGARQRAARQKLTTLRRIGINSPRGCGDARATVSVGFTAKKDTVSKTPQRTNTQTPSRETIAPSVEGSVNSRAIRLWRKRSNVRGNNPGAEGTLIVSPGTTIF